MAGYALKRLFVVVPLLVVISFMTFILNGCRLWIRPRSFCTPKACRPSR